MFYQVILIIFNNLLTNNLTPYSTNFLTGHGPFMAYLERFKKKASATCECGKIGTIDHPYFN